MLYESPTGLGVNFGILIGGMGMHIDRAVIAVTGYLPNNWLGLRLAIGLRRIVTMRLPNRGAGIDVERWGLRMRLHPLDNGCEKGLLFTPQMYETRERAELAAEIAIASGRTFVFVDIGANVGLFSLFVASQARLARIIAIEPDPENVSRLRLNIAANPGIPIQVLPIAIEEAAGTVSIKPQCGDRGATKTGPYQAGALKVKCLPLLEVVDREGLSSIDALKIDVEGAEDRILVPFFQAAPKSFWPRLIVIEDNSDVWRADLFALLADCGYLIATKTKQNVILRLIDGCS